LQKERGFDFESQTALEKLRGVGAYLSDDSLTVQLLGWRKLKFL